MSSRGPTTHDTRAGTDSPRPGLDASLGGRGGPVGPTTASEQGVGGGTQRHQDDREQGQSDHQFQQGRALIRTAGRRDGRGVAEHAHDRARREPDGVVGARSRRRPPSQSALYADDHTRREVPASEVHRTGGIRSRRRAAEGHEDLGATTPPTHVGRNIRPRPRRSGALRHRVRQPQPLWRRAQPRGVAESQLTKLCPGGDCLPAFAQSARPWVCSIVSLRDSAAIAAQTASTASATRSSTREKPP